MVNYTFQAWRIDNATTMTTGADYAGKTLSVQTIDVVDNGDGFIYDASSAEWESLSGSGSGGSSTMTVDGFTYNMSGNVYFGTLTFTNGATLTDAYFIELNSTTTSGQSTLVAFQSNSSVITGDIYSTGIYSAAINSMSMPYADLVNVAPPPPICFTTGTMIATPNGDIAIENLKVGDRVVNAAGDAVEIRWIGTRHVDGSTLDKFPKLRPVRITKDALGHGVPAQDLLVSRQHRILVSSEIAHRLFDGDVLVAAIHLTELPGIYVDESVDSVAYVHLLCDEHEIVTAHGAAAESLYLGDQALQSLSQDAIEEIKQLFPNLDHYLHASECLIPDGRAQKRLVQEHVASSQPLVG